MITLPWPDPILSPNARTHWAPKAKAMSMCIGQAFWLATEAKLTAPSTGPISVTLTFCPPDKRRRDADNMLASCKGYLDGLAQAMGVDDSRFELTIRRADSVKGGRVEIAIQSVNTWRSVSEIADDLIEKHTLKRNATASREA